MNCQDELSIDERIKNESLVDDLSNDEEKKKIPSEIKLSKWKVVKQSNNIILSDVRRENIKLKSILNDLQKFSIEQSNDKSEQIEKINLKNFIRISRKYLTKLLSQSKFHYFIIILVILDLIVVFVDLVLGSFFSLHH